MGQRVLTVAERIEIYMSKHQGATLTEIAAQKGISYQTARKWWRIGRDQGLEGLRNRSRGRPVKGTGATFDADVVAEAVALKRQHRRWGARRVLVEMRQDERFARAKLPSPSRLHAIFKDRCPEVIGNWTHHITQPAPPQAQAVHEVWQVDHQEGICLGDGSIATVCNIRDPYGAAMIASRPFEVTTEKRWRKLTWEEVRQVLRLGFTLWKTLPDSVQNDNEMSLGGNPNDPFPSSLTLWLAGLGVRHTFIRSHRPTDQAAVERAHRTMDAFSDDPDSRANLDAFRQALEQECFQHNHLFPSRASDCDGRPPLTAHPELLRPRRPYHPDRELALFDLQRVYDLLATIPLTRKVNANGQIAIKGQRYTVGRHLTGQELEVRIEADTHDWVGYRTAENGTLEECARGQLKGLTVEALTGLQSALSPAYRTPIQLTFPLPPVR